MSKTFYSTGDIGDLLYGLAVMRHLGGGSLFVGCDTGMGDLHPRVGITQQVLLNLAPYLNQQRYIHEVRWQQYKPFVTHNLDNFRLYWRKGALHVASSRGPDTSPHLLEMQFAAFNLPCDWTPWLYAWCTYAAPVVIARSFRHQNPFFPWERICDTYAGKCIFVGLGPEYEHFAKTVRRIPYWPTHSVAELAAVINGAKLVICNSSAPLAIATGLGKRVVQEVEHGWEAAHTRSCIPRIIDGLDATVELPAI